MLISIAQTRARSVHSGAATGFTLVEMLTVIIIVGLVGVVVLLSAPAARPAGETTALEIAAKIRAAGQLATFRGEVLGLKIENNQLAFYRSVNAIWQPVQDQRGPLRRYPLSSHLVVRLEKGDEAPRGALGRAILQSPSVQAGTGTQEEPDLFFLPTGEPAEFTLIIEEGLQRWAIIQAPGGTLKVERGS